MYSLTETAIIIQARTSSSRLPKKVLLPVFGKPMLLRQIERVQRVCADNKLLVSTSDDSTDDELVAILKKNNIDCYRGSLDDVLDRYYQAAKLYKAKHIVRITGDCPLIDPELIDQVISVHLRDHNDYTSNGMPPTFPDGLDVEVIRFEALYDAWKSARMLSEREHVTQYLIKRPEQFRLGNVTAKKDLSYHRWTVDEPEDFNFIRAVYNQLYPQNRCFSTKDILTLLDNQPELIDINKGIEYNAGLKKSMANDQSIFEPEGKV